MTTPTPSEARQVADGDLLSRLEQSARDLGEHRQTHVVWRDWLNASPANAAINPHAGSAEFHAGVILDYDRHLANIREAIDALAARPAGCYCAHGYTCGACDEAALSARDEAGVVAFRFLQQLDGTGRVFAWTRWLDISELHHYDESGNLVQGPDPAWKIEYAYNATPPASGEAVPAHGDWIAADDVRRLTREIDVALNGEEGAAKQAALCDIACQVKFFAARRGPILPTLDRLAAVAPAGMDGWQPIATAPKDAVILLGLPAIGSLRADGARRVYEGRWDETQETWTSVNGFLLYSDATHWQPLPTPPATAGEE